MCPPAATAAIDNEPIDDLSEFAAEAKSMTREPGCWFARLDPESRQKVNSARLAGHTQQTIARVVTKWGVKIKPESVSRHFRGVCSCGG